MNHHLNTWLWLLLLFLFVVFLPIEESLALMNNDDVKVIISCPSHVTDVDYSNELDIDDPNIDERWNEVSGLAISSTQNGPSGQPIFWGHNDGLDNRKNGTNFAAWDSGTGKLLMTFHLKYSKTSNPPIYNQDWEDMTIGTCGSGSDDEICIYIADVGDNPARLNDNGTNRPGDRPYIIYKLKEPSLEDYNYPQTTVAQLDPETYDVTALTFDYLDKSSPYKTRDVEAVFLDHTGWGENGLQGDLYLVTKGRPDVRIYKIPANVWPSREERIAHYSPKVAGTDYSRDSFFDEILWTSADMSLDGTKIVLGRLHSNYVFLRCPGQSVADALVGQDFCMNFQNPPEAADWKKQFESISWSVDGKSVLTVAEVMTGTPKLVRHTLDYSDPELNGYCPQLEYVDNGNDDLICKVVSSGITYSSTLVGETRPDTWCDAYLDYIGRTPTGTQEPSNNPTTGTTTNPTTTLSPSPELNNESPSTNPENNPTQMPSLSPTPDYFLHFVPGNSAASVGRRRTNKMVVFSCCFLFMVLSIL